MTFPTADEIALAVVTACKLTGDKPIATCLGQTSRARHIALAALMEVFPEANRPKLSRLVGYESPHNGTAHLNMSRKCKWWREVWVDEVVGALVVDQYGEAAL